MKSVFSIVADGASEADRPDKPIDGNLVVGVAVELVAVVQV